MTLPSSLIAWVKKWWVLLIFAGEFVALLVKATIR